MSGGLFLSLIYLLVGAWWDRMHALFLSGGLFLFLIYLLAGAWWDRMHARFLSGGLFYLSDIFASRIMVG